MLVVGMLLIFVSDAQVWEGLVCLCGSRRIRTLSLRFIMGGFFLSGLFWRKGIIGWVDPTTYVPTCTGAGHEIEQVVTLECTKEEGEDGVGGEDYAPPCE
jgi:hypothetical protein